MPRRGEDTVNLNTQRGGPWGGKALRRRRDFPEERVAEA